MKKIYSAFRSLFFKFALSRKIYEILMRLFVRFFKISAIFGWGSDICLKHGFLPLPIHYYSPIPDIDDLKVRKVWEIKHALPGINFRNQDQTELLKRISNPYAAECDWSLDAKDGESEFYVRNPSFSYGCAASTHCMIRYFKPRQVVEIGSGMSSRVIAKAVMRNENEDLVKSHYTIIDPYPNHLMKEKVVHNDRLIENRVETVDADYFACLEKNDILFIDSGHCVKIGGDVNFLFLDVLPRLKPGVIVHIHDIGLPYEYPKAYAVNENFRQFWTEQYLLQAFLCFNSSFQVLLALQYLMTDHLQLFQNCFPHYDPNIHIFSSGSFWIKKIES